MKLNSFQHMRWTQPGHCHHSWCSHWLLPLLLACCLWWLSACGTEEAPHPRSALYFFEQGNAAYQGQQYPRAVYFFRQTLALEAQHSAARYNLALTYYQLSDFARARATLEQLLAHDPDNAAAHHNLALVYHRLHDASRADLHYNRYLTLLHGAPSQGATAGGVTAGGVTSTDATQRTGKQAAGAGLQQPATGRGGTHPQRQRKAQSHTRRHPGQQHKPHDVSAGAASSTQKPRLRRGRAPQQHALKKAGPATDNLRHKQSSSNARDEKWWNQNRFLHGKPQR